MEDEGDSKYPMVGEGREAVPVPIPRGGGGGASTFHRGTRENNYFLLGNWRSTPGQQEEREK